MDTDRKIELGLTAAITLATIVNVVIAIANACIASKQWSAIEEANQISMRPILKVKFRSEDFVIPLTGGGGSGRVSIVVENVGKLPAMLYVQSALNYQNGSHNGDDHNWPSINQVGEKFLFPDNMQQFASQPLMLTAGQIVDLNRSGVDGRTTVFVMADVFYGPQRRFETRICSQFEMGGSQTELRLAGETICPTEGTNYAK